MLYPSPTARAGWYPKCPKCSRAAWRVAWLKDWGGSAAHMVHDLNCGHCGAMALNDAEADKLQMVHRTEIDWRAQ